MGRNWKEVLAVWTDTRSIVVVAVVAALYAALRLPFAAFQIIPTFTEIRPGAVVPPLAGVLFGPPAAWGAAIGNTIGDVFAGMISLGTVGGFVGNFLLAYVPYRMWSRNLRRHAGGEPLRPAATVPSLMVVGVVGALVCAAAIGWFVDAMGLLPLLPLALAILFNNAVVGVVLLPVLYPLILPRARRLRMLASPPEESAASRIRSMLGLYMTVAGAAAVVATAVCFYRGDPSRVLDFGGSPGGVWARCWMWYVLMMVGVVLL